MTVEEFLQKQNRDRIRREEKTLRKLLREYALLDKALGRLYAKSGEIAVESGLKKRNRVKSLAEAVKTEIGKFGEKAAKIIGEAQADEIARQLKSAPRLLKFLGIKDPKIPPGGPAGSAGAMGDGRKLAAYFNKKLAPIVAARVKQIAANSAGAGPAILRRNLKAAHAQIRWRTLTTMRTETVRVARDTALAIYRANPDKLTGWTWHTHGTRACDPCRSMNGTRHPLDEDLVSHPNCRCMPFPDDGKAAQRAEAARVERRYNELKSFGHGVQRHGPGVSKRKLRRRAMLAYDPMTGSRVDGVHGGPHTPTRHATRLQSKAAYVKAEEAARASQEFRDKTAAAAISGDTYIKVTGLTLERVFGPGYLTHVFGITRQGPFSAPVRAVDTDLTDGVLYAAFKLDGGVWKLDTMYPKVKP